MRSPYETRDLGASPLRCGALVLALLLLLSPSAMASPAGVTVPRALPSQAASGYRLTLNVTTDAPLGPLPGASVFLNGSYQGVTSLNGTISLGPLLPANYTVRVEADRYVPVNLSVPLETSEEVPVRLESSATPGVVTGSYTPAGAAFTVAPYPTVRPTQSNASTAFFELLLPPGSYNYTLTDQGVVQRGSFLIDAGKTLTLTLSLPPARGPAGAGSPGLDLYGEIGLVVLGGGVGIGLVLGVTAYRRRKARPGKPPAGEQS